MLIGDTAQGLYVITTEEGFPCKIGITNDLSYRVGQLQIGNWHRLRAVWFTFVLGPHWGNRKPNLWAAFNNAAAAFEVKVHQQLKELDLHISGEWFGIGQEDCVEVIKKVAKNTGHRLSGLEVLEGLSGYTTLPSRQVAYLQAMIAAEQSAQDAIAGKAAKDVDLSA